MNGKIFILFLIIIKLFGVEAKVDKQNVIEGDNVVFSITASGENIEFPTIKRIGENDIEAISNSQNISIINGKYTKTITKTYVFTPIRSLIIPSFEVKVDNKSFYTKPIKINVVKDTKTDKDFKLEVIASKTAIKGYPNLVTIKFYQKTNVRVASINLELPKGDFELKPVSKEKDYYEGVYQVAELNYFLIPKKEGKIDFNVKLKLGFSTQKIDNFGFIVTGLRYKVLQKHLKIISKKLYDGVIGDFNISMKVDKTKTTSNTPINGVLTIQGLGDLSGIENIKFNIPNVTIYDNKPEIKTYIKNNKVYSKYSKKIVFISDNNFTIPSLEFSFFDINNKKIKTISSKAIQIEIKNNHKPFVNNSLNKSQNNPKIVVKTEYKTNYLYVVLAFVMGLIVGMFIKRGKKIEIELPKNLYQKLLVYADNPEIKKILEKLYNKEKLNKTDKEFIKQFLKNK